MQALLAQALKPNRKLVSAVLFTDGTMQEVTEQTLDETSDEKTIPETPATKTGKKKKKEPKAGTTVAAPRRGCPAPDFINAEIRARRVLDVFLNPEQRADFRRHNRFITKGADTGLRYMLTSRHCNDALAKYQRTLYDLDNKLPICTHDWEVPAAEELLSLHVLLTLPGWESYMLGLDGRMNEVLAFADYEISEDELPIRRAAQAAVTRTLADHADEIVDSETRRAVNGFVCSDHDLSPFEGDDGD